MGASGTTICEWINNEKGHRHLSLKMQNVEFKITVPSKPRRFFFRGLIFRGIAGGGGEWRGIPGTGEQIFSPPFHPVRGIFPKKPRQKWKIFLGEEKFFLHNWRGNPG